jgi:hypothetical protein
VSDILTKISKVLAQAEADGVTPEEAEAFFKAAQALGTKYNIDLAVARQHTQQAQRREEPIKRSLRFEAARNTKKHFVNLYHTIAQVNDLRINIYGDSNGVIAFGFPSDIDVTDAIFASVSAHMVEQANAYLKTGEYKNETETRYQRYKEFENVVPYSYRARYDYDKQAYYTWEERLVTKPIDGRTARANFYSAYTSQIGRRLREAQREAKQQVVAESSDQGAGTELALIEKATEVNDYYKKTSDARGSWNGPSSGGYSSSASSAGRSAAQSARLGGSTAVGGSKAIGA